MNSEGEQSPITDGGSGKSGDQPDNDWPSSLPASFYTALAEFNRGDYYQCHETLEALWIPEKRSVRELYQGMLQIAVGCYHLTRRANWTGAINLLERGVRRLERTGVASFHPDATIELSENGERFPGPYGVDWLRLIAAADRLLTHLRHLGCARIAKFDRALLPLIDYEATLERSHR